MPTYREFFACVICMLACILAVLLMVIFEVKSPFQPVVIDRVLEEGVVYAE